MISRHSVSAAPAGAVQSLRTDGCIIIEDAFDPAFVEEMHRAFLAAYCGGDGHARSVGDRRTMVSVEFEAPFNRPELYANPAITSVLDQILGDRYFLGSFTAVFSEPGAAIQKSHRDHEGLFPEVPPGFLPAHAVSVSVPLIALTQETGSTRFWPGSHLQANAQVDAERFDDPDMPVGACGLMDYRLMHRGLPNSSAHIRPILYLLYNRPWFKDYSNHPGTPHLSMSAEELRRVPPEHRGLFSWLESDL